jgi:alpha-ketoglutarate-dependent taurine dioxygenase
VTLRIEPTGATLGAIVSGIRLAELTEQEASRILDAFHEHAVLVFPGQHLTAAQQVEFARRFGDIEQLVPGLDSVRVSNQRPDGSLMDDSEEVMQVLRGNEGWHTDSSYMPVSARASVLSAHLLPAVGGETEWADMRAAYDALNQRLKERIEGLSALHSLYYSQARVGHVGKPGTSYGFHGGDPPLRPLVKAHPVTGRRALYLGRHAYGIPELSEAEPEALLDELVTFACQAPRTYLHPWQPGDVAIWDNRCVLHRARPYDHREPRFLLHTRIAGDPATESGTG